MPSPEIVHKIAKYSDRNYCTVRKFLSDVNLPVSLESCVDCKGSCAMCKNKETLIASRYRDRLLLEVKEFEMIKYSVSSVLGRDVGDEYAVSEWLDKFAPQFRRDYDQDHKEGETLLEMFEASLKKFYPSDGHNLTTQSFAA